jgi:hypothetical protein
MIDPYPYFVRAHAVFTSTGAAFIAGHNALEDDIAALPAPAIAMLRDAIARYNADVSAPWVLRVGGVVLLSMIDD